MVNHDSTVDQWELSWQARQKHIREFGYLKVNDSEFNHLQRFMTGKTVLEVGSGTGWLSFNLEKRGITIHSVDSGAWDKTFDKIYHRTHESPVEDVNLFVYDIILMTWPPYDTDFAFDIAQRMCPGQTLVYEGEFHGCCGNSEFFQLLKEQFNELSWDINKDHDQFDGLQDMWAAFKKGLDV
jgi:hypothetical protein